MGKAFLVNLNVWVVNSDIQKLVSLRVRGWGRRII